MAALANIDVGSVLSGLGTLAKDIRSAITGKLPADKQAEIELKLLELETSAMNAQTEINKIEAGNSNIFISGWRPAIGWTCVAVFFMQSLIRPIILWIHPSANLPVIDTIVFDNILYGLLGIAGLRTVEKFKGVAK